MHVKVLLLLSGCAVASFSRPLATARGVRPRASRASVRLADDEQWAPRPLIAISAEFAQLCQAQFEVLSATVGAARCAVYFRREHPLTGALEFVPVAVYPQAQSVWVVGQDGDLPTVGPRELPGATAAPTLFPNYPFVRQVEDGLAASADETEGECGLRLPDGGVTFPLTTDGHVLGVLTVWQGRGSAAGRGGGAPRLTRAQCACVSAVARSLALSTMLDQRLVWSGLSTDARTEQVLLQQVGHSLRSSVHQLGSPLAALRLFSKLILRRLPADDSETRQLVREMVSQAARMQDLIGPLQALAAQLPPPRPTAAMGGVGDVGADQSAGSGAQLLPEMPRVRPLLGPRQLLWLPDVLGPFARSFAQLAAAEGTRFEAQLDEDLPAVRASDIELRESISNLLDNALRYGDGLIALTLEPVDGRGSAHGGSGCEVETAAERPECAPIEAVRIAVWNSGEGLSDEALARAFEPGFRGARSHERPLAKGGSGLGLSIVLELISGLGGNVRLSNAPAPRWLAERNLERCHAGGALERGTLAEIVLPRASVERAPRGVQT